MSQLPDALSALSSWSAVVSAACTGSAMAARPNDPAINPLIDMCVTSHHFRLGALAGRPRSSDRATPPLPASVQPLRPGGILLERKALRQHIAKISRHESMDG